MAERCRRVVVAGLPWFFVGGVRRGQGCRDRRDISQSITRLHALLTTYGQRQAKLLDLQPHPPTPGIVQAYFD